LGKGGHHPNSLLRNNGDGTFEDVAEQAGILSFHPTQTATWFDFDGDGWLDVFIGNESTTGEIHPCELYRNNGNGTFRECAAEFGVALTKFVKGVNSGDYDNDGRPDLYVSSRNGPNVLFHNDGPAPGHSRERPQWKFSDVTAKAGVAEPMSSFPCWFFDYDNDGKLDIFVTGYSANVAKIAADYLGLPHDGDRVRLYHNNGDGTFADVTKSVGLYKVMLAMGCNFGDFDNDGWLDFYVGTGDPDFATLIPNRAFRNNGGKAFQEVTTAGGFGHLQKGHGIAFADLDNNGSQDIYAVMGGAYTGDNYRNALFVNPGNSNRWLTLKLEGVRSNRAAIGARIRVIVQTESGPRSIYKTVCSGGSFGASPLRQEFGLGQARAIQSVEIFWPVTGETQTITGLGMDRMYRIREGEPHAEPWTLKRFQLASKVAPAAHKAHQHSAPPAR
ncbi:MAG TPA: CRTAC1 family protein, partial [Candidatus Acidoferrum sp.]|nr:CRTAC1 family protein [Candidatus Acidoferrum sp.]